MSQPTIVEDLKRPKLRSLLRVTVFWGFFWFSSMVVLLELFHVICFYLVAWTWWKENPIPSRIEYYDLTWIGLIWWPCALIFLVVQPGFWPNNPGMRRGLFGLGLNSEEQRSDALQGIEKGYPKFVSWCDERGFQTIFALLGLQIMIFSLSTLEKILSKEMSAEGEPILLPHGSSILHFTQELGGALFIAAVVSYLFDVSYHARIFGEPVLRLETLSNKLNKTVGDLTTYLGFVQYRSLIRDQYKSATRRIVSVADYWLIDDEWWKNGNWEECELFENLTETKSRRVHGKVIWPSEIVFAGKAPYPRYSVAGAKSGKPARGKTAYANSPLDHTFSPQDFQRFLGVVWRLVMASKIRRRIHKEMDKTPETERQTVLLEVFIARVPVQATVVDDDAFLLMEAPQKLDTSRGTHLTHYIDENDKGESMRKNKNIADSYYDLIHGYLYQARSAREYVESLLFLAMHHAGLQETDQVYPENIEQCLNELGMKGWVEWEIDLEESYLPQNPENKLPKCAVAILAEYVQSLDYLKKEKAVPTFRELKKDLL